MLDISETEAAYIAGIIDGEGTLTIRKKKPAAKVSHRPPHYSVTFSVSNTEASLIHWLQNRCGGSVHYYENRCKNCRPYARWDLQTQQAVALLQQVIPYLLIKNEQAKLAMEFLAHCPRGRENPRSDNRVALEEGFWLAMRWLNRRPR